MTDDQVVLRLPADSAYLTVLRTAAASLASRLDLTIDDIEDLRIAVDEACALLLPQAAGDLEVVFGLGAEALSVSVSVPSVTPTVPARDSFAWTVLTALAGEITSTIDDERVTLALVKRRAVPP